MFRIATQIALLSYAALALNIEEDEQQYSKLSLVSEEEAMDVVFFTLDSIGDEAEVTIEEFVHDLTLSADQAAIWDRLPEDVDKLDFVDQVAEITIDIFDMPEEFDYEECFDRCIWDDEIWNSERRDKMLNFCEWSCFSVG